MTPLTKEQLEQIAKFENLTHITKDFYVEFMQKRFPEEAMESYAREWAQRFKTGTPQNYMDNQSKAIYSKVIGLETPTPNYTKELSGILKKFKSGDEEALDGDEVDNLTESIRKELNTIEGNT